MKKTFPLRVVLTVTTGRLLTAPKGERDNGIGDLYEILNHMTGDNLYTHQLPRAGRECAPWLLRWFPELAAAENLLVHFDEARERSKDIKLIDEFLLCCIGAGMRHEYEIEPIPADDHERKTAYDELVQMRGSDEGIFLIDTPSDPV